MRKCNKCGKEFPNCLEVKEHGRFIDSFTNRVEWVPCDGVVQ